MKKPAIEVFFIGLLILYALALTLAALAWVFPALLDPKEPDIFDSMLCSVHTPVGAILVNDELIMCSQKIYRRVK
tara:strand:+ start:581 stop:805 length:225 start_codon:yes stop_codon:yes gene_type:complete